LREERARRPADDLLSGLVAVAEDGDRLSEPELVSFVMLLFLNGLETVTNAIGNAVWTVLQHPEELAQLAADPSLLAGAFDESLRLTSPARLAARRVAEDMVVHGRALRRGDVVLTPFGAANRDPRKFDDPDRFDLRRQGPRHLAFGYGPHVCLGAAIGRLQGE